jgi:hypothetical protein
VLFRSLLRSASIRSRPVAWLSRSMNSLYN